MQKLFILIILLNTFLFPSVFGQDEFEEERAAMVMERKQMVKDQIQARGITDKNTLRAMETVPRHLFVPKTEKMFAYGDSPLPIGYGQTISQPFIVAYMTKILNVGPDDTVLEIGTGSGYQAAVLSGLVKKVYTIEIIKELAASAKTLLKSLKYNNVVVKQGDGFDGWPEHAPFDGIVVTAASEYIPPPLIAQLKDGGRMIIPIGSPFSVQTLMMVTKKGDQVTTKSLMAVRFVPLTRTK